MRHIPVLQSTKVLVDSTPDTSSNTLIVNGLIILAGILNLLYTTPGADGGHLVPIEIYPYLVPAIGIVNWILRYFTEGPLASTVTKQ